MAADDDAEAPAGGDVVVRRPRSLAAEIRARLPWIEAQLAGGHTREQVVEALQESGVAISFTTLKTNLQRARRESVSAAVAGPSVAPQAIKPEAVAPAAAVAGSETVTAAASPPQAAVPHMTMEDAMDPQKRAAFADQFFVKKPLVLKPKPKNES
jgi:hypothetical protein